MMNGPTSSTSSPTAATLGFTSSSSPSSSSSSAAASTTTGTAAASSGGPSSTSSTSNTLLENQTGTTVVSSSSFRQQLLLRPSPAAAEQPQPHHHHHHYHRHHHQQIQQAAGGLSSSSSSQQEEGNILMAENTPLLDVFAHNHQEPEEQQQEEGQPLLMGGATRGGGGPLSGGGEGGGGSSSKHTRRFGSTTTTTGGGTTSSSRRQQPFNNYQKLRIYTYCILHGDTFRSHSGGGGMDLNDSWRRCTHIRMSVSAISAGRNIARGFEIFILTLIVANAAVMIWSSTHDTQDEDKINKSIPLNILQIGSMIVFGLEYTARLWCCVEDIRYRDKCLIGRLKWIIRPMSVIDLVAFLSFPFWLVAANDKVVWARGASVLRLARLLRVLSLVRLERQLAAFHRLAGVLASARNELLVTLFVAGMCVVISASVIYYVENPTQPKEFSSIPQCMWWAVTTLSTVGYGDVYPISPAGKVVAGIVAFIGIGLFALPAGILGARFTEIAVEELDTKSFMSEHYRTAPSYSNRASYRMSYSRHHQWLDPAAASSVGGPEPYDDDDEHPESLLANSQIVSPPTLLVTPATGTGAQTPLLRRPVSLRSHQRLPPTSGGLSVQCPHCANQIELRVGVS
eukprot:TRINITY_DN61247_c0_g1_i1.p1 TRINITY_DN61247_c0_g1~~TRINITY_DN61247_c0_g1_i1.p1  ORF type:complete len:625 (-),score=90.84 TRINITY_DN61247_c0_g1_i1:100-1974(-)